MNLIFDNIVFSLQKAGGVSSVFFELIKRAMDHKDDFENLKFLEYRNSNIFLKDFVIPDKFIIKKKNYPLILERYLNPKLPVRPKFIFHSSYFRVCNQPNIINVTTVHDFIHDYHMHGITSKMHKIQKRNSIRKSKAIITVSQNTKFDLMKYMPEINPESIFVIYNGVSNDFKVLENLEVPYKFLKILQKPYILYIGARHVPHKNFKLALKIISQLSCFNLVLVGGLPLSREELDIFTKLKIKEKIIHLSNISTEELNIIYNKAFCLLYPSLYEGFGIPIIEAQKCGCPVIALNNSSISEVSGEGAILFQSIDVDEIIHEIYNLQNTSVRNNLISKGFVNAKRFSWEKTYYETFKLYKDLNEKS